MEVLRATKCEDLIKIGGGGRSVFIYGAKTIAQRACLYLERHGVTVTAFLVSERYENPEERRRMANVGYRRLIRKYKIEDMKKTYEGIYRKSAERQNINFE